MSALKELKLISEWNDLNADTRARILLVAAQFQEATGVACEVISADGRLIFRNAGLSPTTPLDVKEISGPGCDFCRKTVNLKLRLQQDCSKVHRYGTYQAERFGGRYIYFCPNSFTHWAVPILQDGQVIASLIGGPILMIEPDEYLQDEVVLSHQLAPVELGELRTLLSSIPYATPVRVRALTETLYRVVEGLSARLDGSRSDLVEKTDQSSRIAEYIQELKDPSNYKPDSNYPVEKENELLLLVSRGDKINSQKVLNEILGYIFFVTGNDVSRIRFRVQELVVLLSRAAVEGGASIEEIFGLNNAYLLQLQKITEIDDVAAWLARILKRFSDCVFTLKSIKHADLIQKAVHYLNANYGRKISLQDVADHVNMSPSHFSKVFKMEMKEGYVDFLNRIRVDKSKILLRERSIPLIDIAGMVGFDDQSYFSKVFKLYTTISPGRFREARGQQE